MPTMVTTGSEGGIERHRGNSPTALSPPSCRPLIYRSLTFSCLNCHTSKRKCDRKRPCQRCIQLGLTGLCVYEIDDPAARDDPTIDETTRLRNRIAELESLVRELRGKPHPRWADPENNRALHGSSNDATEKWHSRAAKTAAASISSRRGAVSPGFSIDTSARTIMPSIMSPKDSGSQPNSAAPPSATTGDGHNSPSLYRMSPNGSPPPQNGVNGRYPYGQDVRNGYEGHYANGYASPAQGTTALHYPSSHQRSGPASSYSDDRYDYERRASSSPRHYCGCRTNPHVQGVYANQAHQLRSTMAPLRQYHTNQAQGQQITCSTFWKIVDLEDELRLAAGQAGHPGHSAAATNDSELLTPLSAGSGSFHTNGSPAVSPHEWSTNGSTGYNPYFSGGSQGNGIQGPATPSEGMYSAGHGHVMT
ncbi:hypothetical protein DL96DRAFT_1623356 [Flagelloscypha sp. PMI_526]|nr:hypothetical protein DL96DRAFT_1623356 [Flagelloscypha sp. PMI_526]